MSDVNTLPNSEADLTEFKRLQKRLNHESIKNQFRTKAFGGLHEEDVTKYIEALEEKFKIFELENKKAYDEIYTIRTRLNSELEEKNSLLNDLDETKQYLNSFIAKFKQKELDIQVLHDSIASENMTAKNKILQMETERIELEKLLNESQIEINQIKEYAANYENENIELKAKLSSLSLENEQIEELKNEILLLKEERRNLDEALTLSNAEIEQIKQSSVILENDNAIMKNKITELSEENMNISALKNEKIQMAGEIRAYEELLNQSCIEYEQIKNHADIIENENVNMKEKLAELEKNISTKGYEISEINRACIDLRSQLESEKSSNEKLNNDIAIFKQKIVSLQETINEKLQELDEQKKINEKMELELNEEKASLLNYKVNGFKDEFSEMYKKIDNLEYEATQYLKSSSILQKQLAKEQNRAEKAENDLATFMNMLSGVKDKFYSEQNSFDNEVEHLVEKQAQKKKDVKEGIIEYDQLKALKYQ